MPHPLNRIRAEACPYCHSPIEGITVSSYLLHLNGVTRCFLSGRNCPCVICGFGMLNKDEAIIHIKSAHLLRRVCSARPGVAPVAVREVTTQAAQQDPEPTVIIPIDIPPTVEIQDNPTIELRDEAIQVASPVENAPTANDNDYDSTNPTNNDDDMANELNEEEGEALAQFVPNLFSLKDLSLATVKENLKLRLNVCHNLLKHRVTEKQFEFWSNLLKTLEAQHGPSLLLRQMILYVGGRNDINQPLQRSLIEGITAAIQPRGLPMDQVLMGNIRSLRRHVRAALKDPLPIHPLSGPEGFPFQAGIVNPCDAISMWLSSANILMSLQEVFEQQMKPWINSNMEMVMRREHLGNVWNSQNYWDSWRATRSLWWDSYQAVAGDVGVVKIFIQLGIFFDWFAFPTSRRPGHGVIYLELLNIPQSKKEIYPTLLPLALFSCSGKSDSTGRKVVDCIINAILPQIQQLVRGMDVTIRKNRFRVFAQISEIRGDLPAIQELIGLKESASSYHPCFFCQIRHYVDQNRRCCFYGNEIVDTTSKTAADYAIAYEASGEEHSQRVFSIKRRPSIIDVPGVRVPDSITIDIMHLLFLGEVKKHLRAFMEPLLSKLKPQQRNDLFDGVSERFKVHLAANGCTGWHTIRNLDDLVSLKAHETFKFALWSEEVLLVDQLFTQDQEGLRLWKERVRLVQLLCQYTLNEVEADEIKTLARSLSNECCRQYPKFCSLKTHLHTHIPEVLVSHGCFRRTWNFRCEGFIAYMKALFANTNNRSVPVSILKRAADMIAMEFLCPGLGLNLAGKSYVRGEFGCVVVDQYYKSNDGRIIKVREFDRSRTIALGTAASIISSADPVQRFATMAGGIEESIEVACLCPVEITPPNDDDTDQKVRILFDPNPNFL